MIVSQHSSMLYFLNRIFKYKTLTKKILRKDLLLAVIILDYFLQYFTRGHTELITYMATNLMA